MTTKTIMFKIEVSTAVPDEWLENLELQAHDRLTDAVKDVAEEYYEDFSGHLKGKYGGGSYKVHKAVYDALRAADVSDGVTVDG